MDGHLERMLSFLAAAEEESAVMTGTSVRLPPALKNAAAAAVQAGLLASVSEATVQGLKAYLQSLANRAVLDEHYREHPGARPERWEVALAAAEIDGHPLAGRPDLVQRAAVELADIVENPTPDEVLAYAAGLAAAA